MQEMNKAMNTSLRNIYNNIKEKQAIFTKENKPIKIIDCFQNTLLAIENSMKKCGISVKSKYK